MISKIKTYYQRLLSFFKNSNELVLFIGKNKLVTIADESDSDGYILPTDKLIKAVELDPYKKGYFKKLILPNDRDRPETAIRTWGYIDKYSKYISLPAVWSKKISIPYADSDLPLAIFFYRDRLEKPTSNQKRNKKGYPIHRIDYGIRKAQGIMYSRSDVKKPTSLYFDRKGNLVKEVYSYFRPFNNEKAIESNNETLSPLVVPYMLSYETDGTLSNTSYWLIKFDEPDSRLFNTIGLAQNEYDPYEKVKIYFPQYRLLLKRIGLDINQWRDFSKSDLDLIKVLLFKPQYETLLNELNITDIYKSSPEEHQLIRMYML